MSEPGSGRGSVGAGVATRRALAGRLAGGLAAWLLLGRAAPAAAAGRPEGGPGGNPACFRGAHEQPTAPPGEGTDFGGRLRPYLEDCRGEIRRP
jgi:hypothetical protein